jgi:hypothetical protein
MQLNAQSVPESAVKPEETLLRRHDGKWSFTDKGLLRRAGVVVKDVAGHPELIAVAGTPRAGKSFAEAIGHSKFSAEGQEARLRLVQPS